MMKLKWVVIGVAVAGFATHDARAASLKVNFGDETGAAAVASSGEADIVKVKARGVGANKDEALKDAYRDAVERAIGLYVDAEQMVKNDELVKDEVLTHSNAYITHYDEVSSEQIAGGLSQVRIVADVKKGQLTKKLEGVMPPQTVKVNGGILSDAYARLVTQEKRAGDSAALLKAALKDCDPVKSLIVANVRADSQKLLTGDQVQINGKPLSSDKVMLRYLFELKLDRDRYFKEFVPHLQRTLAQISLTQPKEVRLSERAQPSDVVAKGVGFVSGDMDGAGRAPVVGGMLRMKDNPGFPDYLRFSGERLSANACLWPLHEYTWGVGGRVCALPSVRRHSQFEKGLSCWALDVTVTDRTNWKPSSFSVCLVSQMNATCAAGKMTVYDLDLSLKAIVDETLKGLRRIGSGFDDNNSRKSVYNIVFADKDGNELAVEQWKVPVACLLNMCCANESENSGGIRYDGAVAWFITPFVGCFGENYLEWKGFVLDRELLKKIDTIKIELAE